MGANAVRKWTPPEPTIEKAHDVRRLSECTICHHLGIDLIRGLFKGSLVERGRPVFVHAYCLISSQKDGWDLFAGLPSSEIGKITMGEWKALGIPLARIERAYDAAVQREQESANGVTPDLKPTPARLRAMRSVATRSWCPVGTGECQLAARLDEAGLAKLDRGRLYITDEGRAWLARHDAPEPR